MKLTLFIFLLVLTYTDNKEKKEPSIPEVAFTIKKAFWSVKGTFSQVKIDIRFDPKDLSESHISGSAVISSIDTGNKTRDKHLMEENWFFIEKYPKINIQSLSLSYEDIGKYCGKFDINIRGVSIEKTISFNDKGNELEAFFELNLSDFEIGTSGIAGAIVGNKVNIQVLIPHSISQSSQSYNINNNR